MIEVLLASHQVRARRMALGILGQPQLAEEAAQEALLKAYAARDRYDPSRPFLPWFHQIVRNTCRDLRAKRRPDPGLDAERVQAQGPDAESLLDQDEQARALRAGLRRLSEEHREVLELRHFQDLSYEEIAEVLGVAQGTVMSRLYRARRALAKELMP
ncbi:MAG: sigma-70 family RNA polymerase sigma factor [Alphaproteobacteria bacterium]|nr:sigma-70 family RNA polymerase sigma factor [Alphaproteobacteria bacterium]